MYFLGKGTATAVTVTSIVRVQLVNSGNLTTAVVTEDASSSSTGADESSSGAETGALSSTAGDVAPPDDSSTAGARRLLGLEANYTGTTHGAAALDDITRYEVCIGKIDLGTNDSFTNNVNLYTSALAAADESFSEFGRYNFTYSSSLTDEDCYLDLKQAIHDLGIVELTSAAVGVEFNVLKITYMDTIRFNGTVRTYLGETLRSKTTYDPVEIINGTMYIVNGSSIAVYNLTDGPASELALARKSSTASVFYLTEPIEFAASGNFTLTLPFDIDHVVTGRMTPTNVTCDYELCDEAGHGLALRFPNVGVVLEDANQLVYNEEYRIHAEDYDLRLNLAYGASYPDLLLAPSIELYWDNSMAGATTNEPDAATGATFNGTHWTFLYGPGGEQHLLLGDFIRLNVTGATGIATLGCFTDTCGEEDVANSTSVTYELIELKTVV
jgi:hypothetical protein